MTTNIVLPPLKSWATSRLTALIKDAPSEFDAAFDAFVAKDAKITFNGVPQSREEYKKLLSDEQILEQSATINIHNVIIRNFRAISNLGSSRILKRYLVHTYIGYIS